MSTALNPASAVPEVPPPPSRLELSPRVRALQLEILQARPALCAERALAVTEYFRDRANREAPMVVQKAEALAYVLRKKTVRIHPGELLAGCFSSHRVGGSVYPELHGVVILEDLFRFERRKVNPLRVAPADKWALLTDVMPYWATRMMALRGQPLPWAAQYLAGQLAPIHYLINEAGGVAHFVPDYASLLARGTSGLRAEATAKLAKCAPGSEQAAFYRAAEIACDGLEAFADGYRQEALRLAEAEADPARRKELQEIAMVCERVPRNPPGTLREALQSLLFAQIALNLESLDNGVSPGRLDQLLWPFYERERAAGTCDAARAFELLCCFSLKLCEIVPVFSGRITRFHSGMFNGQVLVVGGTDAEGRDATNPLTELFVEVMDRLRMRQPNFHARLHRKSPEPLRRRIAEVLAGGAVSPALYNDEVIVPVLARRGMRAEDARDYATVGCVEPVSAGRSFLSTDAALFDLPLCLELALNEGRRFGKRRRMGAATPSAERCASAEELLELFRTQVRFMVQKMLRDLRAVEKANARWHPTPLTSVLLGCLESGRDATSGGARYNGSGVQGVGAVDVGDSLSAIHSVVFEQKRATLAEVVAACRGDFEGKDELRERLVRAPKYGNDDRSADVWVGHAMRAFADAVSGEMNARGGPYVAGYYSVSAHEAFGAAVGALPSGRRAGAPFTSGLSPESGATFKGPTAELMSCASLPLSLAANGINFNLTLPPWTSGAAEGAGLLKALVDGGFAAGCMQLQVNVFDPEILIRARDNPGKYPFLLVRVSGYSAYFDDLTPQMKQELIDRWTRAGAARC